jgi:cobalt/nickel transport system ATP-binding protein
MSEEVYRLEGVSYSYGPVEALSAVDLAIRKGETISVLGANGSGKSTLLKILDCLLFPTQGTLKFFGEPIEKGFNSSAFRELVGFVFSEPDVQLFSPTVYDEVAFAPMQTGISEEEARKRVLEVLSFFGIGHLKDRAPYELSSGEKKKVALASVLSVNPEVVLFDEPTSALDPKTQVWLIETLYEMKKLEKTLVVATHDLTLAEDISDRVVILDESHRIVADTTTAALRDEKLLLGANLTHEHTHRHGDTFHRHSHGPYSAHDEHK